MYKCHCIRCNIKFVYIFAQRVIFLVFLIVANPNFFLRKCYLKTACLLLFFRIATCICMYSLFHCVLFFQQCFLISLILLISSVQWAWLTLQLHVSFSSVNILAGPHHSAPKGLTAAVNLCALPCERPIGCAAAARAVNQLQERLSSSSRTRYRDGIATHSRATQHNTSGACTQQTSHQL